MVAQARQKSHRQGKPDKALNDAENRWFHRTFDDEVRSELAHIDRLAKTEGEEGLKRDVIHRLGRVQPSLRKRE